MPINVCEFDWLMWSHLATLTVERCRQLTTQVIIYLHICSICPPNLSKLCTLNNLACPIKSVFLFSKSYYSLAEVLLSYNSNSELCGIGIY